MGTGVSVLMYLRWRKFRSAKLPSTPTQHVISTVGPGTRFQAANEMLPVFATPIRRYPRNGVKDKLAYQFGINVWFFPDYQGPDD